MYNFDIPYNIAIKGDKEIKKYNKLMNKKDTLSGELKIKSKNYEYNVELISALMMDIPNRTKYLSIEDTSRGTHSKVMQFTELVKQNEILYFESLGIIQEMTKIEECIEEMISL
jgi:hypothetical protein